MMLHQKIAKRKTLARIPNHAIKIWSSEAVPFIPVCRWDSQPYDQNLVFHSQLCKRTPAIAAGSKENTHPHTQFCLINKTQAGSLVRLASETLSMKNYYWQVQEINSCNASQFFSTKSIQIFMLCSCPRPDGSSLNKKNIEIPNTHNLQCQNQRSKAQFTDCNELYSNCESSQKIYCTICLKLVSNKRFCGKVSVTWPSKETGGFEYFFPFAYTSCTRAQKSRDDRQPNCTPKTQIQHEVTIVSMLPKQDG